MLNHIEIMGRLVGNPELKSTSSGVKYTNIRIACDRDFATGENKQADFIDAVAWRSTAEFVSKYFSKGMPILLTGRLQIREYKKQSGENRRVAEINIDSAYFCGGENRQKNTQSQGLQELDSDERPPWEDSDDLLP